MEEFALAPILSLGAIQLQKLLHVYLKSVSSVGSVGSICKDDCFLKDYCKKVNQHTPLLNQQKEAMNQHDTIKC